MIHLQSIFAFWNYQDVMSARRLNLLWFLLLLFCSCSIVASTAGNETNTKISLRTVLRKLHVWQVNLLAAVARQRTSRLRVPAGGTSCVFTANKPLQVSAATESKLPRPGNLTWTFGLRVSHWTELNRKAIITSEWHLLVDSAATTACKLGGWPQLITDLLYQ